MRLVFACIAPHGGLAIEEVCKPEDRDVAVVTRRGTGWRGELLSYEAPTYFGMLCAAYSPS